MVDPSNTILINTLLPWLQELHKGQDLKVAAKVCKKINQLMLTNNPSSIEYYVEIKEAIDNIKFSIL